MIFSPIDFDIFACSCGRINGNFQIFSIGRGFVSLNYHHLSPEKDVSSYRNSYRGEGWRGKKDITRRDAESLTMETRRVEADKENTRGKLGGNICETDPQNADQSERSQANAYSSQCSDYGLLGCNAVWFGKCMSVSQGNILLNSSWFH